MPDVSQNRHKEKAYDQAEAKRVKEEDEQAGSRKGFGLSNCLMFAFGSVGLAFVGLAINSTAYGG
jgi:hypothetical protein